MEDECGECGGSGASMHDCWFDGDGDGCYETLDPILTCSCVLEGGSSTMYLKYPVGEYLYSDKVAPLSESTPISVYRITISEFEHTYISFTLTFEMTDPNSSYENPKLGMSFLEYEDELVDWRILT